jgi:signal peptidase I
MDPAATPLASSYRGALRAPRLLPTLQAGDEVLVDKGAYRDALPRRGDLVVFHAPRIGDVTLKRAPGLPGDTVAIEDAVLVVNGRRQTEPYAEPDAIDSVYFGSARVPADAAKAAAGKRKTTTASCAPPKRTTAAKRKRTQVSKRKRSPASKMTSKRSF